MADMLNEIDRNTLTNQLMRWLSPNDQGYFITLNSRVVLQGQSDPRFEHAVFAMRPMVVKAMVFLKEHCFGNSYRRDQDESRLKCIISYEVGSDEHRLHAHIVAAHDGSTDRDCNSVGNLLSRKWTKLLGFNGQPSNFVHVDYLDIARDRVWYATKQARYLSRLNGISNIDCA